MSKLNAFLAAIPANGLPSPTPSKGATPAHKAFPSLSIPQHDDPDVTHDDDDGMVTVDEPQKVPQPATPQPQFLRQRSTSALRDPRGATVRDIARRFDSQKGFTVPPLQQLESSNQEDESSAPSTTAKPASTLPPLSPAPPQASTPLKARARRSSVDDGEAGPLKRLSATQQLQQQQTQQGQHHRRISTDTAAFSRLLKRQPDEDIDAGVVQFFAQLRVPTVSRPEQGSNQAEEDVDDNAVDPHELLATFKRGETVSVETALAVLQRATDVMALEPNVVAARAPFTVVGDLHGQFSDLVELFAVHGAPSATNPFLFLGDYVDRGVASCEIILTLLAFKVAFPRSVFLLRGNHECRSLSTFYGFRSECLRKYGLTVYNRTIKCFESMPLAATVATARGAFLAVHGGLSPSIQRVEQINELIDRFTEPDPSGALCDLLWADPAKDASAQDAPFAPNAVRGCSYTFNERVCREFLARNDLLAIIRAHELEERGFREHFQDEDDEDDEDGDRLPPVITVFSAPEYCNTNHNMGATLVIPWDKPPGASKLLSYRQHTRSAHRESEFSGASEYEAVRKFLAEQLPFLPVDFYELVVVCRQLQATLDVAAAIATPVASSASNVMQDKSAHGSDLAATEPAVAEPPAKKKTHKRHTMEPRPEERRSLDHTSTQGDAPRVATAPVAPALPLHTVLHVTPAAYVRTSKPRRRASTGSGLRLCPGFMRFCEKYLGLQFHDAPSQVRTTFIIEPKKRRSIDDIDVGTLNSPALVEDVEAVRPTDVLEIQLSLPAETVAPVVPVAPVVAATKNNLEIFTTAQWTALRLYFSLLDVSGTGVLMEDSFAVLLAEQDSDAYATQEELELLMDVLDGNCDGLITMQDFLQFAYRAFLRWKKNNAPPRRSSTAGSSSKA